VMKRDCVNEPHFTHPRFTPGWRLGGSSRARGDCSRARQIFFGFSSARGRRRTPTPLRAYYWLHAMQSTKHHPGVFARRRSGASATARISPRRATPPRATFGTTPRTRTGACGAAAAAPRALPRANFVPPLPFPRFHRPKRSGRARTRRISRAREWVRRFSF
jgi:hypothetical protein